MFSLVGSESEFCERSTGGQSVIANPAASVFVGSSSRHLYSISFDWISPPEERH
jgi:hypothetical protein